MRERYIVILAATYREGGLYAKRAKLRPGRYRIANRAGQIVGLQVADAHVLPSFKTAVQRHSILSALRRCRDVRMIDVEMPEGPAPATRLGEQLTIDSAPHYDEPSWSRDIPQDILDEERAKVAEAEAKHAHLPDPIEEDSGTQTREAEPSEDAAQAEEATRRRRSRCPECGELRFPEEHDCPADVARNRHDAKIMELF